MKKILKHIIASILGLQARLIVRKFRPRIAAITGSVGKTSTKDALYAVMKTKFRARKSEKSFNNEIGLPLTVLGVANAWSNPLQWAQNVLDGFTLLLFSRRYPSWLVLEVGADHPGDIRQVARWLPVDVAIITHLPEVPVHVEFFGSPEEVMEEKASLIGALKKDGTLVLFADDETCGALKTRFIGKTVTFGFSPGADVRGERFEVHMGADGRPAGVEVSIVAGSAQASLVIYGTLGRQACLPALAAVAAGMAAGVTLEECVAALKEEYTAPAGRMRLIAGIKHTLVIDDSYNSSPAAARAALEALSGIKGGRRIALLADMMELGRYSVAEHRKLGEEAARCADFLVTIGFRARDIAEGALNGGMHESVIWQFEDAQKAGEALAAEVKEGDCILVKGSQSMRTERVVEHLMADPSRAAELLVRQEREWKKR